MIEEQSEQMEKIIELRLELFRSKAKVQKYEQFIRKSSKYESKLSELFEKFNSRSSCIASLASALGLELSNKTVSWKPIEGNKKWQSCEYYEHLLYKYEELVQNWNYEQKILIKATQLVDNLVKENEELNRRLAQTNNNTSHLRELEAITNEQGEKVRQIERISQHKDMLLMQLQQQKAELESKVNLLQNNLDVLIKREKQLSEAYQGRTKQHTKMQTDLKIYETTKSQREKVQQECKNLMEMLSVGDQDYLKHYLRSSGLNLDNQRPHRNKHSIVFDN